MLRLIVAEAVNAEAVVAETVNAEAIVAEAVNAEAIVAEAENAEVGDIEDEFLFHLFAPGTMRARGSRHINRELLREPSLSHIKNHFYFKKYL